MRIPSFTIPLLLFASVTALSAQNNGKIEGAIVMRETGGPLHGVSVLIVELSRSTLSGDDGSYEFDNVPPGRYHVVSHLDSLFTQEAQVVDVQAGVPTAANFTLGLTQQRYEITVTASAKQETPFESFNSVESYDAYDLTGSNDVSLGETLDQKVGTGIAKRSFGPGSARPIIRGFDGDRVLIMEDGVRTGTLSSQSGDHGELINPAQLERLEIVKGPATLLYSGSAIGGAVNAISRHHELHHHPHEGLRGYVTGSGGTANALGGGSAGFEYGVGKWMIWGSGAGIRTGDYNTPLGEIFNSRSRTTNAGGGFGWFGAKTFFSLDAKYDNGSFGIPFAQEFHGHHDEEAEEHEEGGEAEEHEEELERVAIDSRRLNYRVNWGLTNLNAAIDDFSLKLNLSDWSHDEIEFFADGDSGVGTAFDNRQFTYDGIFEQRKKGPLGGRFGFWGMDRKYDVSGEEALSPPVDQTGFAVFGLEELDFEKLKLQFGARLETERYTPAFAQRGPVDGEIPDAVKRDFTGASASAGLHASLWDGGAFVTNYSHTYRAPALEEIYNFGPHVGNLAFEIGDPRLGAESGDGVDLSVRHAAGRVQGELNLFYYHFSNFIFPFATGQEEGGLRVIEYTHRGARFMGSEANLNVSLRPSLWLNLGMDFVDAQDTELGTPLPRIPPLRGRVGFDWNRGGFSLTPELILASQQQQTFTGETRTPGYSVVNLKASYIIAQAHLSHQVSVNVFNIGDRLYRNHSSFIKDLAPEIGRGMRFTYMLRFF